jgi:cell division FtsZ-interacting protein ZapD
MRTTNKTRRASRNKAERERLEEIKFDDVFEVMNQKLIQEENLGKAIAFVRNKENLFKKMPRGKLRTKYLEELERRYRFFLTGQIEAPEPEHPEDWLIEIFERYG